MKAHLEKLFQQIDVDSGQILSLKPVADGLSQQCWFCRTIKGNYIVKAFNAQRSFEVELAVYKALASYGFIAKCVASYQNGSEHLLLLEEVPGKKIHNAIQDTERAMAEMTQLLVQFHIKCDPLAKELSIMRPLDLLRVLQELREDAALRMEQNSLVENRIESLLESNLFDVSKTLKHVVCHGDMNANNVIGRGEQFKLIDFETASLMPVEYDLAMMLAVNELDASWITTITNNYKSEYQKQTSSNQPIELNHEVTVWYYQVALLINGLWYSARRSESKLMREKAHLQWQLLGLQ